MRLLLTILSFTSLISLGLTVITQDGMLLYSWREWADKKYEQGYKIVDPLIRCHWCMPSIFSLVGYGFAAVLGYITHFSWRLVFLYPLAVCGASIVNGVVWGYISLVMAKIEYYKKMAEDNAYDPNEEGQVEIETTEYYYKTNN